MILLVVAVCSVGITRLFFDAVSVGWTSWFFGFRPLFALRTVFTTGTGAGTTRTGAASWTKATGAASWTKATEAGCLTSAVLASAGLPGLFSDQSECF